MASRRYGVWDMVALHARVGSRRTRPRRVPSLGHRPTRLQRGLSVPGNWSPTTLRGVYFIPFSFSIFLIQIPLIPLSGWIAIVACGVAGALGLTFALWGALSILLDDPRCIPIRRKRDRLSAAMGDAQTADELVRRRKFWRLQLDNPDSGAHLTLMRMSWRSLAITLLPLTLVVLLIFEPIFLPGAIRSRSFRDVSTSVAMMGLCIVLYSVSNFAASRRKKALHRSTLSNVCPECAYEQPRGTIGRTSDGTLVDFGPPRCPECGTPWPLIPPET